MKFFYYDDNNEEDNYELTSHDYESEHITVDPNDIRTLENEIKKVEGQIRELWNNIMVPYLENADKQILNNLTCYDYSKFFDFIITNNAHVRNLYNRYNKVLNRS